MAEITLELFVCTTFLFCVSRWRIMAAGLEKEVRVVI